MDGAAGPHGPAAAAGGTVPDVVRWHDLECGGYDVDLPLWRELAAEAGGPVLDCGAGTGRIALDLARRGVDVTALDVDEALLAELRRRADAQGLSIATVAADARDFALARRFALVLVPMQTVQLLGGPEGRRCFLARVHAHLRPGGRVAAALADALEGYEAGTPSAAGEWPAAEPPLPDMREWDGSVWSSRPVAVRVVPGGMEIERVREVVDAGGGRIVTEDRITLDEVDRATLEREALAAGLRPEPARQIPATEEYVGSVVVVARA